MRKGRQPHPHAPMLDGMETLEQAYRELDGEITRLQGELVAAQDADNATRAALATALRTAEWAQEMLDPLIRVEDPASHPKAEAARVNLARLADLQGEGFIRAGNPALDRALAPTQAICAEASALIDGQQISPAGDLGL